NKHGSIRIMAQDTTLGRVGYSAPITVAELPTPTSYYDVVLLSTNTVPASQAGVGLPFLVHIIARNSLGNATSYALLDTQLNLSALLAGATTVAGSGS